MALITCPDCGKAISDAAPSCIGCGRPMHCPAPAPPPSPLPPQTTPPPATKTDQAIQPPPRPLGTRWLKFYSVGIPCIQVSYGLASYFEPGARPTIFNVLWSVALSAMVLTVGVGLAKRRHWGWVLNWFWLACVTMIFPVYFFGELTSGKAMSHEETLGTALGSLVGGVLYALCWTLPNVIYFRKRAGLFHKGSPTGGPTIAATLGYNFQGGPSQPQGAQARKSDRPPMWVVLWIMLLVILAIFLVVFSVSSFRQKSKASNSARESGSGWQGVYSAPQPTQRPLAAPATSEFPRYTSSFPVATAFPVARTPTPAPARAARRKPEPNGVLLKDWHWWQEDSRKGMILRVFATIENLTDKPVVGLVAVMTPIDDQQGVLAAIRHPSPDENLEPGESYKMEFWKEVELKRNLRIKKVRLRFEDGSGQDVMITQP